MTEAATQILAAIDTLPPDEQHEILTQLLRRTGTLSGPSLSDDDLTALADDLFQTLDAEEATSSVCDADGLRNATLSYFLLPSQLGLLQPVPSAQPWQQ